MEATDQRPTSMGYEALNQSNRPKVCNAAKKMSATWITPGNNRGDLDVALRGAR